jgi:exopolysaccharide biosynthesis polyprenyl glycosylphosphotransferase
MSPDSLDTTEKSTKPQPAIMKPSSKRSGKFIYYLLPVLYVLGDIGGIYLSFFLAYEIRFDSPLLRLRPYLFGKPELSMYLYAQIFVCVVWVFIFAVFGHYKRRSASIFDRFYETARGVTIGTLFILATNFFYRGGTFSRLVLVIACIVSVIMIWSIREIIYQLEKWHLKRGVISKRAVIVGDSERGIELYRKLIAQPAWGIVPLGFVCDRDLPHPRLGAVAELDEIVKSNTIDLVIFNLPHRDQDFITDFVMKSDNLKLEYMLSPDTMGLMIFNAEAGQIEGIPVVRWGKTPIEGYSRAVKRLFDIIFSGIGIIVASPLILIVAIAVKLDSPGPVLFRQRRMGRNGKLFTMYKFRSMKIDEENARGRGWTVKDDPRRTRVGRMIRKYNLDELPQLFNVFLGRMSLVGPRPEQPDYVEKFKDDIPRYFQRHRVKSGLTGWAQVNGFRGDTSITERTKYDLYYVENWSPIFDIKILLLTLKNIFKSPNAY